MKFTDIYEFIKYLNDNNLRINETVDVTISPLDNAEKSGVEEITEVQFIQLRDSPKLKVSINDSITSDVLLVDSYETVKDLCGVGKISWRGREIVANICESDGKAYASFDTKIDDLIVPSKKYLLIEKPSVIQYNDCDVVLTEGTYHTWRKSLRS